MQKFKGTAIITIDEDTEFKASATLEIKTKKQALTQDHLTDAMSYMTQQVSNHVHNTAGSSFEWFEGEWFVDQGLKAEYPLRKGRKLVGTHGNYKNKEYRVVKSNIEGDRHHIEFVRNLSKPYPTRRQGRSKKKPFHGSGVPSKNKDVLTEHQICNKFKIFPTKAEKVLYDKPKI